METLVQSPTSASPGCLRIQEHNGFTNRMGLADSPESDHATQKEPVCPATATPKLKRKNSQRRLRIPTEDHQLFLSGLNDDILPYINECRLVNNSSDENAFSQLPARNLAKSIQNQPTTFDKNRQRILQNGNGHAITQSDHFDSSCNTRESHKSKFLYNNNNVTTFMDDADDDSVFQLPEPRRKAYNSPKKAASSNSNCVIV